MDLPFSIRNSSLAILMVALTLALGYGPHQSDFAWIISLILPFFLCYWLAFHSAKAASDIRFFLILAIVLRILLLFALPHLSDDIYRFIWDGRLLNAGYNPFDQLPAYYLNQNILGIDQALFDQLNSPEYFTIYPPVAQGIFAIACWLFPKSIWASALVMKLFLLAFEIGSIYLLPRILKRLHLPQKNTLLYALNPLIIIEICGNLHFEGAMIFFLLLAFWLLLQGKNNWSALALGMSIASKLLPLIFLPLMIRRLGGWRSWKYFAFTGGLVLLLFLPLVSSVFLSHFGESLDLYFRRFEFNASSYYVLRWIGFQIAGYNLIAYLGPALALVVLSGVLAYTFTEKMPQWINFPQAMLFAICLYLFCTTTVHPWYTALPIVLCLFTSFRFPILWSALIFLTYVNYSYSEYWENLWVVGLEYALVFGMLIGEYYKKRPLLS